MDRRTFIRLGGALGGGLMFGSLEPWERLTWALQRPSLADQRVVDDLESVTVALSRLEREFQSPRLLLNPVSVHLDTLTTLMKGPPSDVHRQLCSLAAETAALAGWLRWDLGDFGGAAGYFKAGLTAAREAGDEPLAAYLLGSLAAQPFYQERPERRLRILDGAGSASPHTLAWLRTLEAGAYALAGRVGDFQVAIDEGKELLLHPDDDGRRPRAPFFNGVYLAEEEAAGYLRLDMPASARVLLEQVLPKGQGRMRLWLEVDLAYAAAAEGEPELACQHAIRILADARSGAIEPVLENLRRLPNALPSTQGPEVAELVEALGLA